ncbi:conserved hypothetical protein [Segniliparus rotundus DSM 44985]|uniref:DUF3263 domain-containing protein n=1 Tax=Segniliparus rotundus (strain ATCC BAA-972 / CDC 1076 / CIP 108378 / DSM 44985 / JCM 13578) TaxID=640132 RepID=D6ZFD8_SEGRD|nr:DUF3263 domain-containing protein [Segniliparus rotundus]ADG97662.1 conserved hypothetical protein [Segniliparus rotundus DSM 44985]
MAAHHVLERRVKPDPASLLAFERAWWRRAANKDAAVREAFGLGPIRYYQLLNQALDDPAAVAAHPQTANRLRRLREARPAARALGAA